jgi:hypothetical protein
MIGSAVAPDHEIKRVAGVPLTAWPWANRQDRIPVRTAQGTEMTSEQLFVLVIVAIAAITVSVGSIMYAYVNRHRIKRVIFDRLHTASDSQQRKPLVPDPFVTGDEPEDLISEEDSETELKRLKKLIEDRKRIAKDIDISHHLWGLYKHHFRFASAQSSDPYINGSEWYNVKTLRSSAQDGLNEFEFELKGARYRFVDDEERHGWSDNIKFFSLFLYDDSNRCLIEIPMKVRVDKLGRSYSISSDGPNAFLPGGWIKDFISVKLKQQSLHNRAIRAQKHRERLSEIRDLKDRFGIWE